MFRLRGQTRYTVADRRPETLLFWEPRPNMHILVQVVPCVPFKGGQQPLIRDGDQSKMRCVTWPPPPLSVTHTKSVTRNIFF
jgi:hypothetical protein